MTLCIAWSAGGGQSSTIARNRTSRNPGESSALVVRRAAPNLDSVARAFIAAGKAPGMAIVVMRGRDTLLAKGYGTADAASRRPVSTASVFRIGSITKQFTAALIMRQVAGGSIRLTDSISRFVPTLRGAAGAATIAQLLSHTSGIASYTELSSYRARGSGAVPPQEMVAMVGAEPLRFPHGEQWAYNNSGYYLLGLVLERVTGQSYARLVQQLVRPLGLRATGYCGSPDGVMETVTGYDVEDGKPDLVGPYSMANPFAAGALCASAADLTQWLRALMSGTAVSGATFQQMIVPALLSSGRRASYGLGLEVTELGDHVRVGHGGSIPGFDSYAALYPKDSLTIVVLTNNGSANAEALEKTLARHALGMPVASVVEVPISPKGLARYLGNFRAGPGRVVITQSGTHLHVTGPVDADLVHVGNHTFVLAEEPDVKLVFQLDADTLTGLAWTSRGRTFTMPKVP